MKRETREVPNQFARQHNDYVSEETARAGTFNIRNVSEDVIGTYWRREPLTDTQKDAARIFQSNYQTPKLVGSLEVKWLIYNYGKALLQQMTLVMII